MRIAVVGCGAVAERGHLPALKAASCFDVVALVDRNESRARALAESFGVRNVFTDFVRVLPEVDAAIVALPHSLHAPAARCIQIFNATAGGKLEVFERVEFDSLFEVPR